MVRCPKYLNIFHVTDHKYILRDTVMIFWSARVSGGWSRKVCNDWSSCNNGADIGTRSYTQEHSKIEQNKNLVFIYETLDSLVFESLSLLVVVTYDNITTSKPFQLCLLIQMSPTLQVVSAAQTAPRAEPQSYCDAHGDPMTDGGAEYFWFSARRWSGTVNISTSAGTVAVL